MRGKVFLFLIVAVLIAVLGRDGGPGGVYAIVVRTHTTATPLEITTRTLTPGDPEFQIREQAHWNRLRAAQSTAVDSSPVATHILRSFVPVVIIPILIAVAILWHRSKLHGQTTLR
jgi:hypothetical protein